jgi:hypothetical protein
MEKVSDSIAKVAHEVVGLAAISGPAPSLAVHLTLAGCSGLMVAFSLLASPPGASQTGTPLLVASLLLLGPLLVPAAYWHQQKNFERR